MLVRARFNFPLTLIRRCRLECCCECGAVTGHLGGSGLDGRSTQSGGIERVALSRVNMNVRLHRRAAGEKASSSIRF
jgi:hypothetical protein